MKLAELVSVSFKDDKHKIYTFLGNKVRISLWDNISFSIVQYMGDLWLYAYLQTWHYRNNKMRKIYFLQHLNQPLFAVEFSNDSLQYCSDSCFAFETFLWRLSVKKSQQFLQWCLGGLDIFPRKSQRKTESWKSFQELELFWN